MLRASAPENPNTRAWELMAGFSAGEAMKLLEQQPFTPERELAMATALLGKFPQTGGNVDRAEVLLKEIVQANEGSGIQAAALYLLGRIAHIFHDGREQEAAGYYRQLREKYPDDQLADSAAVKLALIALDNIAKGRAEPEVRAVIDGLAMPRHRMAQSDFHMVLAEFYLERGNLPAALDRLLKVRELDANRGKNEADLLVQIGRVAGELGRTEISSEAYRTFLKRFPTDTRNYMVREQLKEIAKGGSR